jgi:hypothetical protein
MHKKSKVVGFCSLELLSTHNQLENHEITKMKVFTSMSTV